MKNVIVSLCLFSVLSAIIGFIAYDNWQNQELCPTEYASLYALRLMAPQPFFEHVLPDLEKAMSDSKITRKELNKIQGRIKNIGPIFFEAAKKKTIDEQISQGLDQAVDKSKETGNKINDSLNKTLNNIMDFVLRKSEELSKQLPSQTPKDPVQEPKTF